MSEVTFAATMSNRDLKSALTAIKPAIAGKRPALPICTHLHAEATENTVRLSATDLEHVITTTIPATVDIPGFAVLDHKSLTNALAGKAAVSVSVNGKASATAGLLTLAIPNMPAEDFPVIPPALETLSATVLAADFLPALAYVLQAVAKDDTRPTLTGLRLAFDGATCSLESTDDFRMHFQDIPCALHHAPFSIIVPYKSLATLSKLKITGTLQLGIAVSDKSNQAQFRAGAHILTTRLIEGSYPNLRSLIPSRPTTTWLLDTAQLRGFAQIAAKMAESNCMRITEDAGGFTLSYHSIDNGDASAPLSGIADGAHIPLIEFNAAYILDALKDATDTVEVRLTGSNSAIRIGEHAVVMPMHTNR